MSTLTEEQRERIKRNKELAQQRLAAHQRSQQQKLQQEQEQQQQQQQEQHLNLECDDHVAPQNEPSQRCEICGALTVDEKMRTAFRVSVCVTCLHSEGVGDSYALITKSEAKKQYLVMDWQLKELGVLERSNPRKAGWRPMQLFLARQVQQAAESRWGSAEALEAERERRRKARERTRATARKKARRKRGGAGEHSLESLFEVSDDDEHASSTSEDDDSGGGGGSDTGFKELSSLFGSTETGAGDGKRKRGKQSAGQPAGKKAKTKRKPKKVAKAPPPTHAHKFSTERHDADTGKWFKVCDCGFSVEFERI